MGGSIFLTAASCPDQKSAPKRRPQKVGKKVARKAVKKLAKKYAKKAHCHIYNTHANHQEKNFLKHIPEPILLLS